MGWKEASSVSERTAFIRLWSTGRHTMVELCELFGVSRKTGYKFVERYEELGWMGLEDRPRAAHSHPNAIAQTMVEEILRVRRRKPRWGPRKIIDYLRLQDSGMNLPAVSTAGEILKREGLVVPRRRRRAVEYPGKPFIGAVTEPNDLLNIDFKGHFATLDGKLCHPLTLSDTFSRALLISKAMASQTYAPTQKALERQFRKDGLPRRIRSDNGEPFISSRSLGGLSRLGVWLTKLGVTIVRCRLASPQDNSSHERMHRTLKEETALPPARDLKAQQRAFDRFRREFNEERPHQALDGCTPASLYSRSPRSFPKTLPTIEYPAHFTVRMVRQDGMMKWRGKYLFLSEPLGREPVGLVETAYGIWSIYFGPVLLGLLDDHEGIILAKTKLAKSPDGNVENR